MSGGQALLEMTRLSYGINDKPIEYAKNEIPLRPISIPSRTNKINQKTATAPKPSLWQFFNM
ncbi:hypothetical protein [Bacillus sp. m3-13]|uniref:hypothetical protein n=1 Tax=Bacillus sp. m3-13 TaxID=406124 RepID=UPI002283F630|nr:hypothetical protein [Bacillus sp. m3-13]